MDDDIERALRWFTPDEWCEVYARELMIVDLCVQIERLARWINLQAPSKQEYEQGPESHA